ncbi:MAG: LysM peptidoglycan-binding domain-containing protein, partial [Burkholderiales bacterium]|nr:LysM peptidoglycan-binding domain-containing protein [Burkholderiales bacterium]
IAALQAALGNPALTTGAKLTSLPATLNYSVAVNVAPYYSVQAGDTWASITNALYGTTDANAASALQAALGNPALTAGAQLTSIPATLNYITTISAPPHYFVQAGDTWTGITQALYGTSHANAVAALQAILGNPALTAGTKLDNLPPTLDYSITVDVTPYYQVQAGDTWAGITNTLYGTTEAHAIAALKTTEGNPTLSTGTKLYVPSTLNYEVTTQQATDTLNSAALSTFGSQTVNSPLNNSALATTENQAASNTLNNAALNTTDVQNTNTTYSLNAGALTATNGSWSGMSSVDVLAMSTSGGISDPIVAYDQNGNGLKIWVDNNNVYVSRYAKNSNAPTLSQWSAPVSLASDVLSTTGIRPNLVVSPNGNALVTWVDTAQQRVYAKRFVNGVWDSQSALLNVPSGYINGQPTCAISDSGKAVVAFWRGAYVYANVFNGSAWQSTPTSLNYGNLAEAQIPQLGMDANGNVTAMWMQAASGEPNASIFVSRYDASTATWSTATGTTVENFTGHVTDMNFAVDGNGNGLATWLQDNTLYSNGYTKSTDSWSGPIVLATGSASNPLYVSSKALALSSNGNGVVTWKQSMITYARRYANGAWLGTGADTLNPYSTLSNASPVAVVNDSGQAAVLSFYNAGNGNVLVLSNRYNGSQWVSAENIQTTNFCPIYSGWELIAYRGFSAAIDASGDITTLWLNDEGIPYGTPHGVSARLYGSTYVAGQQYYTIPQGATWTSVASALYGTSNVASQLQSVLGNPALTAGSQLTGLPTTLTYSTQNSITVPAYYQVQAGDTWTSITQALYGTSNANAVTALQTALGNPALTTGAKLTSLPSTLNYTVTVSVAPYYSVTAGDTWASITNALYGTTDPNAASALQTALGNLALTTSAKLTNIPATLNYTTIVTVTPYYQVQAGDTWESITNALYGTTDPNAIAALQTALGNPALTAGAQLTNIPATLNYTATISAPPHYFVQAGDTWTSITQALYGTSHANAVAALQAALGNPALTAGTKLNNLPATLDYSVTVNVTPYYQVQAGDTWAGITNTLYGTTEAHAIAALQTAEGNPTLSTGTKLYVPSSLDCLSTDTNGEMRVTDALGNVTTFISDLKGQLIGIQSAPVNGVSQQFSYTYNVNGDVTSQTDGLGHTVTYQYDANGNQILQRDAAGNTITRTYGSKNELLTETIYAVPDSDGAGPAQPSQAITTRYAYDNTGHLRFTVSAEGRITEYRYNASGQQVSNITYAGNLYDLSGLSANTSIAESALAAWAAGAGVDKSNTLRIDTTYDFRGLVASVTRYAKVDGTGAGVSDGTQSTTYYIYDQAGQLLKTIAPKGVATTGNADDFVTRYTYDGLGRLLSTTDSLNIVTLNQYDDATHQIKVTLANGLATTSTYDAAGELISVTQSDGANTLGQTSYQYDALGRLRMVTDASGVTRHSLYDEAGRKVADIDGDRSLTEYVYNANSQVIRVIQYATPVSTAALVDGSGNPASVSLAAIRPATSGDDRSSWSLYAAANRLVKTVDALGYVTETQYDGASRVTAVIRYANAVNAGTITANTQATDAVVTPASSAADRRARSFYDNDGRLLAVLDAEGYLSENQYDAAGRLIHTISYAAPTNSADWAAGTLAQLRPAANAASDIHTWKFYDAESRLIATVDGEGYLTETMYDVNGNATQQTRYGNKALIAPNAITGSTTVVSLRPDLSSQDRTNSWTYTDLNQVKTQTDNQGTVTQYIYDDVGNLIKTDLALGTANARTLQVKYDKQGHVIGELTAEGSTTLAALSNPTQAQIDAVWTQYGISHQYDSLGRRIATTDQSGNRTLFYYDAVGHLTLTVSALGEVTENRYNSLNQLTATARLATRIDTTGLTGGMMTPAVAARIDAARNDLQDSKIRYMYNLNGAVATRIDEEIYTTTFQYDAFGEVVARTSQVDHASVTETARTVFDANGRVLYQIDAAGIVTRYAYDQVGRVTRSTRYANTIATAGLSLSPSAIDVESLISADLGRDLSLTNVYDRDGRLVFAIDGTGSVTQRIYDSNGNVLRQITYATRISAGVLPTFDAVSSAVAAIADPANDTLTVNVYDAGNRLAYSIDGIGVVTSYTYDENGNLISSARYANQIAVRSQPINAAADVAGLLGASPEQVQKRMAYDASNRLVAVAEAQSADANGNLQWAVTSISYDSNGNVASRTEFATLLVSANPDAGAIKAWVDSAANHAANDRTTVMAYDATNRLIASALTLQTDAAGRMQWSVTSQAYDAAGNVIARTVHASSLTSANAAARPSADDLKSWIADAANYDPAHDQAVRMVYDRAGRVTATATAQQADANSGMAGQLQWSIVKQEYDGNGNVVSRTAYATSIWSPTAGVHPNNAAAYAQLVTDFKAYFDNTAEGAVMQDWPQAGYSLTKGAGDVAVLKDADGKVVYTMRKDDSPRAVAAECALIRQHWEAQFSATFGVDFRFMPDTDIYVPSTTLVPGDTAGKTVYEQLVEDFNAFFNDNATGVEIHGWQYADDKIVRGPDDTAIYYRHATDTVGYVFHQADGPLAVARDNADIRSGMEFNANRRNGLTDPATQFHFVRRDARISTSGAAQSDVIDWINSVTANAALDQTALMAYDASGRLKLSATTHHLGANGQMQWAVVRNEYDGSGNLVVRTAYANMLSGMNLTPADIGAPISANVKDAVTRMAYDSAGRLLFSVDALGGVVGREYDAFGNVIKQTAYAVPVSLSGTLTADALRGVLNQSDANNHVERRIFDAAGHLTYTADAEGDVTHLEYDARGNLVKKTAYANKAAIGQSLDNIVAGTADQVTSMAYDFANRLVYSVDAEGDVSKLDYDAFGNVVQQIAYALKWSGSSTTLETLRSGVQSNPNDRVQRNVFDSANRLVYSVDAAGFVAYTQYDGAGRIRSATHYAAAISAGTPATLEGIVGALGVHPQGHANWFEYNAAGQLAASGDPMNFVESYTYDALGQKRSFTNKNGATWTYRYDAGGHLTDEIAPEVEVATLSRSGAVITVNTPDTGIVTHLDYDAFGRLATRTEAANIAGAQRSTSYSYDALGRQVTVTYPPVAVYQTESDAALLANGANGAVTRTDTQPLDLSTATTYDIFGNAVANQDVGGKLSFKVYDKTGSVRFDIDVLGYVTGYERDAFGNVSKLVRYADALPANVFSSFSAQNPPSAAVVEANLGADARVITTTYDKLDRAVKIVEPVVFNYDSSANVDRQYFDAGKTTVHHYDAFGNVVETDTLRNKNTDTWARHNFYFDRRNQLIEEIDALNYVTTRDYDAYGNLTVQKEYATAVTGPVKTDELPALLAGADDRETRYQYDENNRKVAEIRVAIAQSTVSDRVDNSPTVDTVKADATTLYDYDKVGNQTKVTDALGGVTRTEYDALGRIKAVVAPMVGSGAGGILPLTVFQRDAFGNVVVRTDYAQGANSASAFAPAGLDAEHDRTSYTFFNSHGLAIESVDALGHSSYASYDRFSHVAKTWQASSASGSGNSIVNTFDYDALGRLVNQRERYADPVSGASSIVNHRMQYNAFGEVIAKGINGYQEHFDYDAAGRMWRTNSGDGAVKVNLFDLAGQQTAELKSIDRNLDDARLSSAKEVVQLGGLVRTDTIYDLAERQVRQIGTERHSTFSGNFMPSDYAAFKRIEDALDQFFHSAPGTTSSNWDGMGGSMTLNADGSATYSYAGANSSAASYTFTSADGPLKAVKECAAIRAVWERQYNLSFNRSGDNYAPRNYDAYRLVEADFDRIFTWVPGTYGWANGTVRVIDSSMAVYTDTAGHAYRFFKSDGPLTVAGQVEALRTWWESVYQPGFSQDEGITVEKAFLKGTYTWGGVTQTATGGEPGVVYTVEPASIRLEWSSLESLGSGEIRVDVDYVDGVNYQDTHLTQYFSASFAANGVTIDQEIPHETNNVLTSGGVSALKNVFVSKKSADGSWKVVMGVVQDPAQVQPNITTLLSAPSQIPIIGSQFGDLGNFVFGSVLDDPSKKLQFEKRAIGASDWQALIVTDFGGSLSVDTRTLAKGSSYEYRTYYLDEQGQVQTVDTGTITVPLDTLSSTPTMSSAGILSWDAPADPAVTQTFRYRTAYSVHPNDATVYESLLAGFNSYFATTAEGSVRQDWPLIGYSLTRSAGDTAILKDASGNVIYTMHKSDDPRRVAADCALIRQRWEADYSALSGKSFYFIQEDEAYTPTITLIPGRSDGMTVYDQLVADFNVFFNGAVAGTEVYGWLYADDKMVRGQGDTAIYYRHATDSTGYVFHQADGPLAAARDNADIRAGMELNANRQNGLTDPATQFRFVKRDAGDPDSGWVTFAPDAVTTAEGKSRVDLSHLTGGVFDYEVVQFRNGSPVAHANGVLTATMPSAAGLAPVSLPYLKLDVNAVIPALTTIGVLNNTPLYADAQIVGNDAFGRPIYANNGAGNAIKAALLTWAGAAPTAFRFRVAGNQDWLQRPVFTITDAGTGQTLNAVNLTGLGGGNYEFEALYSASAGASAYAHSVGKFSLTGNGSYKPSDNDAYAALVADFAQLFTLPTGTSVELWGGTVTRTNDDGAIYIAGGQSYIFEQSQGPLEVAAEIEALRNDWEQRYQFQFVGQNASYVVTNAQGYSLQDMRNAYAALRADYAAYFQTSAAGQLIAKDQNADGTADINFVRADAASAYLMGSDMQTITQAEGALVVANRIEALRLGWETQFGFKFYREFGYVSGQTPTLHVAAAPGSTNPFSGADAYAELLRQYDNYFEDEVNNPIGSTINWMGGILKKTSATTAEYTPLDTSQPLFTMPSDAFDLVNLGDDIRNALAQQYGIAFQSQSYGLTVSNAAIYNQLFADYLAALQVPPGTLSAFINGHSLIMTNTSGTAIFTPDAVAVMSANDLPIDLVRIYPELRNYWSAQYSITFDLQADGSYLPSNQSVYEQLVSDYQSWFNSATSGQVAYAGGMLIYHTAGAAYLLLGRTDTVSASETPLSLALRNDIIRQDWQDAYGIVFTQGGSGYYALGDQTSQTGWGQLVTAYQNFMQQQPGERWTLSSGAYFIRTADNGASFVPAGQSLASITLTAGDTPLDIAARSPRIRSGWESQMAAAGLPFVFVTGEPGLDTWWAPLSTEGMTQLQAAYDTYFNDAVPGQGTNWSQFSEGMTIVRGTNLANGQGQAYVSAGGAFRFFQADTVESLLNESQAIRESWAKEYPALAFTLANAGYLDGAAVEMTASASGATASTQTVRSTTRAGADVKATTSHDSTVRYDSARTLDRWSNVLAVTDPSGNGYGTAFHYNANNQVVEQDAGVKFAADGSWSNTATTSVSRSYYDALGRQAATENANHHVNAMLRDAWGNVTNELHTDGGNIQHAYNAFGEESLRITAQNADGLSNHIVKEYDQAGRLTKETQSAVDVYRTDELSLHNWTVSYVGQSASTTQYHYDLAGRRIDTVNNAGETTYTSYDTRGNVARTEQPGNVVTTAQFDANNHKTLQTDANGNSSAWDVNYFGQTVSHTGISIAGQTAVQFQYEYNGLGQLSRTTSSRGAEQLGDTRYQYDEAGNLIGIDERGFGSADDTGAKLPSNLQTRYALDGAGRHVRERTTRQVADNTNGILVRNQTIYQDNRITYDAQGRLFKVEDGRYSQITYYDLAGNRKQVITEYDTDPMLADTKLVKEAATYAYRFEGATHQKVILSYEYDVMERNTAITTQTATNGGALIDDHKRSALMYYDRAGNLTDVITTVDTADGTMQAHDKSHYDAQNRLVKTERYIGAYLDSAIDPYTGAYTGPYADIYNADQAPRWLTIDLRQYDQAGRVVYSGANNILYGEPDNGMPQQFDMFKLGLRDTETKYVYNGGDHRLWATQMNSAKQFTTYDKVGNVTRSITDTLNYLNPGTYYDTTYKGFDGYVADKVELRQADGAPVMATTNYTYDAYGHLQQTVMDNGDPLQIQRRTMVNSADGQVLQRTLTGKHQAPSEVQHFLIANGQQLGESGHNPSQANFDPSFAALAGQHATSGPRTYVVAKDGETLEDIARMVWGDSSLWYKIADTNGLTGGEALEAGQVLTLPADVKPASNNATTFQPYDPSRAVGDTLPSLPIPAKDNGCGEFGTVVMVFVAFFVTCMTAGATKELFVGVLGEAMAVIADGAIAGAAGSLASQAVGNIMGVQDGFNWKDVALAAISGAVGGAMQGVSFAGLDKFGNAIVRGAISSALSQGISVATGLQKEFSWVGVAAAAVSAGVGEAISDSILGTPVEGPTRPGEQGRWGGLVGELGGGKAAQFMGTALKGFVSSVAGTVVRGGQISTAQIVGDVFGNALGSSLASGNFGGNGQQTEKVYGATFADDMAARKAMNPLMSFSGGSSSGDEGFGSSFGPPQTIDTPPELREGWVPDELRSRKDFQRGELLFHRQHDLGYGGKIYVTLDPGETSYPDIPGMERRGDSVAVTQYSRKSDTTRYYDAPIYTPIGALEGDATNVAAPSFTKQDVSFASLAKNFAGGIGDTAYGLTIGTLHNGLDLLQAAGSVAWNELGVRDAYNWSTNSNAPKWYADLNGPTAEAYRNGTSQFELALANTPILNVGVLSYHATTATLNGDWNGLARQAGGVAGGFAVGAGVQRYGNYNVRSPIYMDAQPGTLYSGVPIGLRNPLVKNIDFGAHLRQLIGDPPPGMIDPHAHHILFKEGNGAAQKALVQEGQALLKRYDIDPIMGVENLTWAPNRVAGQHGIDALRNVVNSLKQVEQFGGDRAAIVKKLQELGQLAAQRK